jgi:uncharacterized membrane protein
MSRPSRFSMARLRASWYHVYHSFWFVPAVMSAVALAMAWATVQLDVRIDSDARSELWFVFDVGSEGARGVLQAIAGSMITVTGTVFSITIIVLQLASQQYTPRVLRNFSSNRFNHVVLGGLIATFTYSLIVLRTVRSSDDDVEAFVPSISVSVAVLLTLASIGLLVGFIHSVAEGVRAATIINRVTHDVRGAIEKLFPEMVGEPAEPDDEAQPPVPPGSPLPVVTEESGYLQSVDDDAVFDLAREGRMTVRMERRIGDFLLPGEVIATVWLAPGAERGDVEQRVLAAFVLGGEKTLQQDVERGLIELLDIAARALSPSLNDPTTAIMAIDRLAELLVRIGTRRFPPVQRSDDDGRVCFVARRHSYEELVTLAFDQIRHHGRTHYVILVRLAEVMGRIAAQLPPPRRAPLRHELDRVLRSAEDAVPDAEGRDAVRRAVERARDRMA